MRLQDYDTKTDPLPGDGRVDDADHRRRRPTRCGRSCSRSTTTLRAVAGQSVGVLAPGQQEFGQDHHFRLYTVADVPERVSHGGRRITLCVRRCNYIDEYSGERYDGIASNYLCDLKPGDHADVHRAVRARVRGPRGARRQPGADRHGHRASRPSARSSSHIYENVTDFKGKVVLFHGAHTGLDLLYRNDEKDDFALYYDRGTFEAFTALASQPAWNDDIDWASAMHERGEEIWSMLLQPDTYVYVAGLEKIRDELDKVFEEIAGSESKWARRKAELEAGGRWVELLY